MRTLTVNLRERSYPILIGPGLLEAGWEAVRDSLGKRVAIVTNEVVAPLYLDRLRNALEKLGVATAAVILPDGEAHKNGESLNAIYDRLLAERCDRSMPIIALGGGVVGDLAGFRRRQLSARRSFHPGADHIAGASRFVGGRENGQSIIRAERT